MLQLDLNAIIVRVLSKVVKFVLTRKSKTAPQHISPCCIRAVFKELRSMLQLDLNAIIVRVLSKVVKFVLTLSLLLASMSAF